MVKLRVAARILSEDDYLKSLQGSTNLPVKGEKRLVVVVREPYKWQIGTLALEVQRAYQSCYQQELPTIKYLKDNADDCDLDPRAYVSDLLLDEGKAQIDACDQRVTIKVILEQGRTLREGSVAIGSQLDDPEYRIQLEKISRPPVPTFPSLPSSLGKRPSPIGGEYLSTANASKRPRQVEIPETQREDQAPISSIERDDVQGSLELVAGTQFTNPDQELGRQQTLLRPKQESPRLRRLLHDVSPARIDELEELSEQPPTFGSNKRPRNRPVYPPDSRESRPPNGLLSSSDSFGQLQKRLQGPITPPSETSRRLSTSANLQCRGTEETAKSAAQSASASASKFKRRETYPESDIDDSQMSPRSRQAQLSNRNSKGRLSHIEDLQSPREQGEGDKWLSISQAMDVLDDESVFEDVRPSVQSVPAPEPVSGKPNTEPNDEIENSIYEDADTGYDQHSGLVDPTASKYPESKGAAESQQVNGEDKENEPSHAMYNTPSQDIVKGMLSEGAASRTQGNIHDAKSAGWAKDDNPLEARPEAKRSRKRKSDTFSMNSSRRSSVQGPAQSVGDNVDKQAEKAPKPGKKAKASQTTTSARDSPGEQLSQNLRESTGTRTSLDAPNKKLTRAQKKAAVTTPARRRIPGKDSEGPDSVMSRSTASKKDVSLTTPTERIKNQKLPEKPALPMTDSEMRGADSSPSIVLRASRQDDENANELMKPLPNWNSGPGVADKPGSSVMSKAAGIDADKQTDSGKSPHFGLGLTPEEIKTMESRKGMTKEQYEAEKKRKQQEAKKKAESQKWQEMAAKMKPIPDVSTNKTPRPQHLETPEPHPAMPLAKNTASKNHSVEDNSWILKRTKADVTTETKEAEHEPRRPSAGKANSSLRESSGTSFSHVQIPDSRVPPKTPAKARAKSPSVKPSTVSKTPKSSVQPQSTEKASSTNSSVARKSTPAPIAETELLSKEGKAAAAKTPQPRKPTLETAKRLVDLHEVVRSANKSASKATTDSLLSRVNAAKQRQKPLIFNIDDDDEESDDSEEDDEEEVKVVAARKIGQQHENNNTKENNDNGNDSDDDDSSSSSSSPSSSSSSDGDAKDEKSINDGNRASQTKGEILGRSAPSLRDKSGQSDDDESDSDSE
ncbi:uncharacterized protein Z519_04729 [Cladophialophora bantiana CBS 173.52]|uniref:Nucleolar protein Dnt1-like N-terminal domain-containing protein n=1 Tax=Cladophialophora bantiana (strain ATCC 10958 / CBS 173.52 / CDC B-1940 / NIH 8579) TaxID=1442370 RepID=A0A0D2G7W9_CLAB1|nr:uncharacterized protein Z519_04729 [Cladophialophora bantiana CBS 173.52]KIW94752.1 hypothetical protein Z519_04729 [Cladophialophora bantiana CBS 173.52]